MSIAGNLKILGFDHLEVAVADLDRAADLYLRLGFEKIATRELRERRLRSYLMVQNRIAIVLSQSSLTTDPVAAFVSAHGDGILSVGFLCEDAVSALELAVNRGARVAEAPRAYQKDFGSVQQASIFAMGEVRQTFISREGNYFAEGFDVAVKPQHQGCQLEKIDHIACTVEQGKLEEWTQFYATIFGLEIVRPFDLPNDLKANTLRNHEGTIRLTVSEPQETKSSTQAFLDVNHGPGVQHVALSTTNLVESVRAIRGHGVTFHEVTPTYYDTLLERVPQAQPQLSEIREQGLLADGSSQGHQLQAFTKNAGPFFYEIMERHGEDGLGEGSFVTLIELLGRHPQS